MNPPTVLILAGEASADGYAADVVAELRERRPDARFLGMGGPAMESAGVELMAGLDELAVMGFAEIVRHLEFFRRLEARVEAAIQDSSLVIPVDYPGFNMRMAAAAHRLRKPVVYYISPKFWAWRAGRARALARTTDRVAAIFPFEVEMLEAAGARATFVGNPLLDRPEPLVDHVAYRARWGLDPERPILAVLPGSRRQELARHLGPFREVVDRVQAERPETQPVVARTPTLPAEAYVALDAPVVDDAGELLRHARAALVKSGTATLEAVLAGTPSIVAYRTSALSWEVVKRVLRVPWVSLPNLVAGEEVVPEFIQPAMVPTRMAEALLRLLDPESPERERQLAGYATVRDRLGTPGAAGRVADIAVELLEARR